MIKAGKLPLVGGNVLYTFIKYGVINEDQESNAGMAYAMAMCNPKKHERISVNRYYSNQDDLTAAFVS